MADRHPSARGGGETFSKDSNSKRAGRWETAQLVLGSEVPYGYAKKCHGSPTLLNYASVLCLVFEGPPRFESGCNCCRSGWSRTLQQKIVYNYIILRYLTDSKLHEVKKTEKKKAKQIKSSRSKEQKLNRRQKIRKEMNKNLRLDTIRRRTSQTSRLKKWWSTYMNVTEKKEKKSKHIHSIEYLCKAYPKFLEECVKRDLG